MTVTAAPPRQRRPRPASSHPVLTAEERRSNGKALRATVPLAAHAEWAAGADRDDPVSILERQSATRLTELIPERYARMSESPFRFYRGAAALMAADLATTPATGLRSQLCGDAHMLNFRLLASAERRLIFDINDFDETLPGPWEWDVKRLAASMVIAGRANGYNAKTRRDIVLATVGGYRNWMRRFADMRALDVWHTKADMDELHPLIGQLIGKRGRKRLDANLESAKRRDNVQAVKKLTTMRDGRLRIISDPPLLTPIDELLPGEEGEALRRQLAKLVETYARSLPADRRHLIHQYRVVDMARKVVGVGSVGTRCWIILLVGSSPDDALLLQVKEASESVLAPLAGASEYANCGERVVQGQRLMQASSDIFLGWIRTQGVDGQSRDFYVRQLRDWKGIAVPEEMVPVGMKAFGTFSGATLARAHAKSGDRMAIASYLGRSDAFDRALSEFAELYADQNESDAKELLNAIAEGRVRTAAREKDSPIGRRGVTR